MANSKGGSRDGFVPPRPTEELSSSMRPQSPQKKLAVIEEDIEKESLNETLERDKNLANRLDRVEGLAGRKAPSSKDSEKRPMSSLFCYKPTGSS